MALKAKIFHFLNRFVPTVLGTSGETKDVWIYGHNNLLPNENIRLINNSGIAKRAMNKLKRYIEADGFADENAAKLRVNQYQSGDEFLSQISSYVSYFGGFACIVKRMPSGQIGAVEAIPFECVRKRKDGSFTYNPLLGQPDYKESETTIHPAYFGQTATLEQIARITTKKTLDERGREVVNEFYNNPEIFYVYEKTADNPNYPVPDYTAGIEDIKTSIELQHLDLEASRNSFMPSSILITHEMDDETEDDKGKTEADYFEQQLAQFTGQVKNSQGESGRSRLMWIQVKTMEEAPRFEQIDAKAIIEASTNKRDAIERTVARWIGVHPVLLGYSDAAVLGNTQAIANASKDLTDNVNPLQRMISSAMKKLFPTIDWTITQFTYWNQIPDKVFDVLTEDEKRGLAGLQPIEKNVPSEAENTLKAISTIPALVANEVLKELTTDEKRALIGKAALTPEQIAQRGTNS